MLERTVEEYFVKKVKAAGGVVRKFVSPGRRGVADRLVFFPGGRLRLIELKRPMKGKLSVLQEREAKRMRDLGHIVDVLDTKEKVDIWIQNNA